MTSFQSRIDEMEKQIKEQIQKTTATPSRFPRTNNPSEGNTGRLPSNSIQSNPRNSPILSSSSPHNSPRTFNLPLESASKRISSTQSLNNYTSPVDTSRASTSTCSSDSRYSVNSSPGDCGLPYGFPRSTSATSSPCTPLSFGCGLERPGSAGTASGGSRKPFNLILDAVPQVQSLTNSDEIEKRYAEIMKQAGVLTLNGEKISCDISELERIGELGQGTCGQVVKMMHRKTRQVMAVKQMRKSGNSEDNKRIIMDLDVVMKSHSCPYIVQCIGTFITGTDVWICMELMATCLDKLTKSLTEPIPENILGKVTVATVNALHYLKESHGVIHRDVKPSNILLDERGMIKLCDFGISGHLVDSKAKTRSAGCAAYMAPERIVPPDPAKPDYDIRADVWSLGLSLVELATGEFPYKNCKTDFEMLTKVLEDEQPVLPSGKNFSMDFRDFVNQCLTKDYHQRPKYKKLLEHNFVRRYSSLNVDVANWYRTVMQTAKERNFYQPSTS